MTLMDSLSLWGLPSCRPWSEFDEGNRPLRAALRFAAISGEVQGLSLLLLASWALLFLCLYLWTCHQDCCPRPALHGPFTRPPSL